MGLVGFGCFAVVYSWTSRWWDIPFSILASWSAFLISGYLLAPVQLPLWAALVVGLGASNLARVLMPKLPARPHVSKNESASWDLPLRMAATAGLVYGLTTMAQKLGPGFSGVLTPFPVASTVLAGFTHYHHGGEGVARLLRGSINGMQGFALFCAALSMTLIPWGLTGAFVLALVVCAVAQWVVLKVS